jgi:HTH-type transcriptional regulator / antitoxin HipB
MGFNRMNLLVRSPKALGNIIQTERKRQGLSQASFGEHINMRQSVISMVEKGHSALKLENLLSILAALDLDIQITPRTKGSIKDFADMM